MAINPNIYSYSRNTNGVLLRSDNVLIPENDPNNGAYKLYQQWIAAGNAPIPGEHQPNYPHTPPGNDEDTNIPVPPIEGRHR